MKKKKSHKRVHSKTLWGGGDGTQMRPRSQPAGQGSQGRKGQSGVPLDGTEGPDTAVEGVVGTLYTCH